MWVTVGIPKAVPPEEQHQRLHTIQTVMRNRLKIVQPFTNKMNNQPTEVFRGGAPGGALELLQYLSKTFCHPTAQKMRYAKIQGNRIHKLKKKDNINFM